MKPPSSSVPLSAASPAGCPPTAARTLLTPQVAVALLIFAGLAIFGAVPRLPAVLGLSLEGKWFVDSYAILASHDAIRAGLDPLQPNPLDLYHRPHVYSDWWLPLHHLGLGRADNFAVGLSWVGIFFLTLLASVRVSSWRQVVLLTVCTLSPVVLLAVQRANNDLVIFSLIAIPLAWWQARPARPALTGVIVALLLGTGLKYYPIVPLLVLAVLSRRDRRLRLIAWIGAGLGLVILATQSQALGRAALPYPDSFFLLGAPLLLPDFRFSSALAAGLLALGAGVLVRTKSGLSTSREVALAAPSDPTILPFVIAAALLLGCFVVGLNYAYRWIFAVWLLPHLWQRQRHAARRTRRWAHAAILLLIINLWIDGLYFSVVNLGHGGIEPTWLQAHWHPLTQPFVWLFFTVLAGHLLGLSRSLTTVDSVPPPAVPARGTETPARS